MVKLVTYSILVHKKLEKLLNTDNMGHTTEGASEGEAGIMWNLSSSVLHIRRVHCEHMLGEEKTHEQLFILQKHLIYELASWASDYGL